MTTIQLTAAQALVKYLTHQYTVIDGQQVPLFAGVFGIFGHGNVTCFAEALQRVQDVLPTWRGQNEQGMALAAIAYAKAKNRRQMMIATSSVGPGATNMVTACGVAMANRLPLLVLSGDTFASRLPDPVLQQVEHFHNPTTTVNDSFKAVTRYWDRLTHPEQLMHTLPQMMAVLTDAADCGPVFLGMCQDVQAMAYDYPEVFFTQNIWHPVKNRPDTDSVQRAAQVLKTADKPLIIAGGGVRYSGAHRALADFADKHCIPVAETVAGKASLVVDNPHFVGPIGTTGSASANACAAAADVVVSIGCRLQDFTTASWTVFNQYAQIIGINAARFDAVKHRSIPVVGDALVSLQHMTDALGDWQAPTAWLQTAQAHRAEWHRYIASQKDLPPKNSDHTLTYAQVVGVINTLAGDNDYLVAAAGGLPGEVNTCWDSRSTDSFDCEYGFSCMGYEISGGWGAAMARSNDTDDTIVMVGDGSYMMLNMDIYSSVLSGHKMIVIVCDNGGYAVINRLQVGQGGKGFNNLYQDCRIAGDWQPVDFVQNAKSMGADGEFVTTAEQLGEAFKRAKQADKTYVISIPVQQHAWTESGAWWEVGVPEVSPLASVNAARKQLELGKQNQRKGV